MDALHRIGAAGIPILNAPRAVEIAVDKYLSLAMLAAADIPVPTTWAGQSAESALAAFDALGGDVVVKPLFGSEGHGLLRVSDRELAWRTFHTLERIGAVLYLQESIAHPGHDLRAFVLSGRLLGGMRRYAPSAGWRTNVSQGGRAELCQLDANDEALACAAARAVGAEMAGVDLMFDERQGRTVVLEVNAVPGWRAFGSVTGIDVAAEILAALRDAAR
jgi:ribosomal protein S6--L-glutamate ligase